MRLLGHGRPLKSKVPMRKKKQELEWAAEGVGPTGSGTLRHAKDM